MIGPHQNQPIVAGGKPLADADKVVIAVHGRGARPVDILGLASAFDRPDFAYLAPQANGSTWYPYSFLAPMENNEPHLSSALQMLDDLVQHVEGEGIAPEKIAFMGFSQGACLASEYVARHAKRYGGLIVFSGGVIGPDETPRDYAGSMDGTPVFIGCSDIDAHIPLKRVKETTTVFNALGAAVDERIYPGMGHLVNEDEIGAAQAILDAV